MHTACISSFLPSSRRRRIRRIRRRRRRIRRRRKRRSLRLGGSPSTQLQRHKANFEMFKSHCPSLSGYHSSKRPELTHPNLIMHQNQRLPNRSDTPRLNLKLKTTDHQTKLIYPNLVLHRNQRSPNRRILMCDNLEQLFEAYTQSTLTSK